MTPALRAYLDHASSSQLRQCALDAMISWLAAADPGRIHFEGRSSRQRLEDARDQVAALLGARPREVVFTSGATESVNAAVYGSHASRREPVAVLPRVESAAVRESSARWAGEIRWVNVDPEGFVLVDELDRLVHDGNVALVHCQLANQEVGTLQPVREVADICQATGVLLHVDATAATGVARIDFDALGVDLMSVSCHHIGGPTNVGALLVRRGLRIDPLLLGGAQERARRAGLENVAGAVGFAAVAETLVAGDSLTAETARARLQAQTLRDIAASLDGTCLYGPVDPLRRLPGLVCLGFDDLEAEPVLVGLDQKGVAAHSGSSCSSEMLEPSPVLAAMGFNSERSLRFSVGWNTSDAEIDFAGERLAEVVGELRRLRAN